MVFFDDPIIPFLNLLSIAYSLLQLFDKYLTPIAMLSVHLNRLFL